MFIDESATFMLNIKFMPSPKGTDLANNCLVQVLKRFKCLINPVASVDLDQTPVLT